MEEKEREGESLVEEKEREGESLVEEKEGGRESSGGKEGRVYFPRGKVGGGEKREGGVEGREQFQKIISLKILCDPERKL